MNEPQTPIQILADAIADVGHWRFWDVGNQSPQLEFGGIQLRRPDDATGEKRIDPIALRFGGASLLAFLSRSTDLHAGSFADALAHDEAEPPSISFEKFALDDPGHARELLKEATECDVRLGDIATADFDRQDSHSLVFWAGHVGLAVAGTTLEIFSHEGVVDLKEIPSLNSTWWSYWNAYWKRRGTADAFAKDWVCEVVIPAK